MEKSTIFIIKEIFLDLEGKSSILKMSKLFSVPLADLTEKKICEKYVSMSAEEWQKESDRMRAELNNQLDRLKVTKTYYSSILNCKKMFKGKVKIKAHRIHFLFGL